MTETRRNEAANDSNAGRRGFVATCLIFLVCWIAAAVTANGFLEDDAWTHYLYSRFAFARPAYLLDVWGRPICTGLYALAAPWAGMAGCRVISLLIIAVCVWLTMRTAKRLQMDPHVSAIFLVGQPMVFLHSLSVMTELPFAVLLIAAFLAYVERRWWAMALIAGLLPLARPEGFGFILIGASALGAHRRWKEWPLLLLPLLAWSWLGWRAWGSPADQPAWRWLIDHWPYSASSSYGHGSIFQFVVLLPILLGGATPFVILALARYAGREWRRGSFASRTVVESEPSIPPSTWAPDERVSLWLIAIIPLLVLVAHSLLWWLGKMASYGEIRYLLIASPFWAMLAANGWQQASIKPSPAALAAIGLLIVVALKVTVLRSSVEGRTARDVTNWYRDNASLQAAKPRVIASHPAVYVDLDLPPGGWNSTAIQNPADDAVVIWEPKCGSFNADNRLVTDAAGLEIFGWKPIANFGKDWVVMVKR